MVILIVLFRLVRLVEKIGGLEEIEIFIYASVCSDVVFGMSVHVSEKTWFNRQRILSGTFHGSGLMCTLLSELTK